MIKCDNRSFTLDTKRICLNANAVPWDSEVFTIPVASITKISLKDKILAQKDFDLFKMWVLENSFKIVSCRLPHQEVGASIFLETNSFRFIEMVLHPIIADLRTYEVGETQMEVQKISESELPEIVSMAEKSFGHERYHVDPRIDTQLANVRYGNWIRNSFYSTNQEILKVQIGSKICGFFVIEESSSKGVYWHLNAVNPQLKGQKLGYNIWSAMIKYHKLSGMHSIRTTIAARNTAVLNLYSKLNFRFDEPEMTFHWVKPDH